MYTYMCNGVRHPCNTKSDPRFGTAICPPFLECLTVVTVLAAGKTKNRRAYKRDSALRVTMQSPHHHPSPKHAPYCPPQRTLQQTSLSGRHPPTFSTPQRTKTCKCTYGELQHGTI